MPQVSQILLHLASAGSVTIATGRQMSKKLCVQNLEISPIIRINYVTGNIAMFIIMEECRKALQSHDYLRLSTRLETSFSGRSVLQKPVERHQVKYLVNKYVSCGNLLLAFSICNMRQLHLFILE